MTTGMIVALAVVGVLVLVALWFMGIYNRLVSLKALVDEAWSGIDVQLKRRYDLIPNLVTTVKQYSTHEKEIFEKVAQMRALAMGATSVAEKGHAEAGLSAALKSLFAVVENYPQLRANENFMSLQKELSAIEHEIQLSRRYYNGAVRNYNIVVQSFPSSIIAGVAGFAKAQYFELGSASERENPKVQF